MPESTTRGVRTTKTKQPSSELKYDPIVKDALLRIESEYAAAKADFIKSRNEAGEMAVPLLFEQLCLERFDILAHACAFCAPDGRSVRPEFVDLLRGIKARVNRELSEELADLTLELHPNWKAYTAERVDGLLEEQVYRCLAQIAEAIRNRRTIGQNIEHLRELCDWTHEEMADVTGTDQSDIRAHENNNRLPRKKKLQEYADAFSRVLPAPVTVDEIQGRIVVARTRQTPANPSKPQRIPLT